MDIKYIIEHKETNLEEALLGDGKHINCQNDQGLNLNTLFNKEAKEVAITWLEKHNLAERQINYKLKDWIFSRQRYWWESYPVVYFGDCSR